MSAYSRDDLSRSTTASHHNGSLLHVQHALHPAKAGGRGTGEEEKGYILSPQMVALSLLEEKNCAVLINC